MTHINFFTLNSFQSVFRRLGYGVQTARQEVSNYGKAYMEVMWLIATNNGESLQSLPPLPSDAHRYLRPNRTASLKKIYASKEYTGFMSSRGFAIKWADAKGYAEFMDKSDAQMGDAMKAAGLARG